MARHRTDRTHGITFKREVVQEYLGGETLHGLAHRHDLFRTVIRIWVDKYKAGASDEDTAAASTIQEFEARIAALKRLVGKQAPELEFLKWAQRHGRQPRSAPMSVITGPTASTSPKDAD
ncbi:MAG: transposase [Gammaproteobacteria bacterium]|nr:transposase [Gammaproteobacteria bacterium]